MPDLNDASSTKPPPEAQAQMDKNAEESRKLDWPTRTNDSTIHPEKPKEDILRGFHGAYMAEVRQDPGELSVLCRRQPKTTLERRKNRQIGPSAHAEPSPSAVVAAAASA